MRKFILVPLLIGALLLSTLATTSASPPTEPFGPQVVTVVRTYPVDPILPPNPVRTSRGAWMSSFTTNCNPGQHQVVVCEGFVDG
jgi:hypothetical protein